MNPQEIHHEKGQLIFDRSSAKPFLRKDIKDEKHKIMSPRELQASRAEYAPFDSDIFRRRIYQEVCCNKMLNLLNQKREEEKVKYGAALTPCPDNVFD